jgi:hypothetical protein
MHEMNVRFLIAGLALWLYSAGGCAAGPKVVTDYDSSVQFSAFRTFAFSGISDRGHEVGPSDHSPLRQRVKEMVHEQITAKGVRQVSTAEGPDLLVHLFYGVKDLERVQTTGTTPGLYGPQAKVYAYDEGSWVPVPTSHTTTYEDHEGTLIVDLAQSSDKKLVWRAVIKAVLDSSLEKNFELADKGIAKAFENYPPVR